MQKNTTSLWAGSAVAGLFSNKPLPSFLAPHGALHKLDSVRVLACARLSRSGFNVFESGFFMGNFVKTRVGPRLRGRV
jgi:hypothetical protein